VLYQLSYTPKRQIDGQIGTVLAKAAFCSPAPGVDASETTGGIGIAY
jgi:hypothetical protein